MILDAAESVRTSAMMLDFNKQVNASIVDPEIIVSVRKKLALDQREAAEILGAASMRSSDKRTGRPSRHYPCQATQGAGAASGSALYRMYEGTPNYHDVGKDCQFSYSEREGDRYADTQCQFD